MQHIINKLLLHGMNVVGTCTMSLKAFIVSVLSMIKYKEKKNKNFHLNGIAQHYLSILFIKIVWQTIL